MDGLAEMEKSGTGSTIHSVFFLDSNNGWISGNGKIYQSTDGGNNWSSTTYGSGEELRSLHFADSNNGWVVGQSGKIYHTYPNLTTYTDSLKFNTKQVNGYDTLRFTLYNTGIDTLFDTLSTTAPFSVSTTNDTIEGGDSSVINVVFNPTSEGFFTDSVNIKSNSPDSSNIDIYVSGWCSHVDFTSIRLGDSTISSTNVTDTIAFTLNRDLVATDEIVLRFPSGFDVSGLSIDGGSSFTPAVESASSNSAILSLSSVLSAGNDTLILAGINNPSTALSDDTLKIIARQNTTEDTLIFADQSPAVFNIVGTLTLGAATNPINSNNLDEKARIGGTAIELANFKLTVAGENVRITQIQITPTFTGMTAGEISNFDVYFDANNNGSVDGGESSIASPADDGGSGNPVTITIDDTVLTAAAQNYIVTADFANTVEKLDDIIVDIGAASTITSTGITTGSSTTNSGNAISGYSHQVTIPHLNLTSIAINNSSVDVTSDTVTIDFTTYASMAANDTMRLHFPCDFSFTNPSIGTGSSFTPAIESSTDSTLVLRVTGAVTTGNKTLVIAGVNNPALAIKDKTIDFVTLRQGTADTIHVADSTPDAFNIVGTLTMETADNPIDENALAGLATVGDTNVVVTTFKLTTTGENSIISQVKMTPTYLYMSQSEINIIDIYKDDNSDGYLDTGEQSIASSTVDGPVSGNTISFNVSDTVDIGSKNYLVVAAFKGTIAEGDSFRMNVEACSQITAAGYVTEVSPVKSGSAITGYYHKATPPVINVLSTTLSNPTFGDTGSVTVVFTTNQNLLNAGDEIVITFPDSFDISNISLRGANTPSGYVPIINDSESSGQTIVLDISAPEPKGQFTFVFDNIINPPSVKNNLYLEIYSRLDDDTEVDGSDYSPAVFDVIGQMTITDSNFPITSNNFDTLFHKGGTAIPVTSFKLIAEKENINLTAVRVFTYFGGLTTDELTKIDIYEDTNGNGIIDSGETSITNGTGDDNGKDTATNINITGYTLPTDTINYIVTVDLAGSVGAADWLRLNVAKVMFITGTGAITGSSPTKLGEEIKGITHVVEGFELVPSRDTTTVEGREISFTADYVTTYSGSPEFEGLELPLNAGLDSLTGVFTWTPDLTQAGIHTIRLRGSLQGVTGYDTVSINVSETNILTELVDPETTVVNSNLGGTVQVKGNGAYTGHKVTIPPGAMPSNGTVIAKPPDTSYIGISELDSVPSAVQFDVVGSETGYTFEDSITLTLEYKPFEVKNKERNMRIFLWDKTKRFWKRLFAPHSIDLVSRLVSVKEKHFSIFGVREVPETADSFSVNYKWNMISVPLEPGESNPVSLFGTFINPFRSDEKNSNIYRYNEDTNTWSVPNSVVNGNGYVLYGWNDVTEISLDGLEVIGDVTKSLSYTSGNGWHLIGNPFAVSIDWDDNVVKTNVDNYYYRWNGSEYEYYPGGGQTSTISSWEGFFVKANSGEASVVIEYPGLSKKTIPADGVQNVDWRIGIAAQCTAEKNIKDTYNYAGISQFSSAEYDKNDAYELVSLNDRYVSLYFPHEDWEINPARYTQDIKPLTEERMEWQFEIMTNAGKSDIELSFEIPENVTAVYKLLVIDRDRNNKEIDLSAYKTYSFRTGDVKFKKTSNKLNIVAGNPTDFSKIADAEHEVRHFTLIVEKKEDTGIEGEIPDTYFINQNYPNPFNPSTTIEYGLPEESRITIKIFNILGQKVKTLVSENKPAGFYKITWNGDNDYGNKVASGIYIYRMNCSSFVMSRKLIIIK